MSPIKSLLSAKQKCVYNKIIQKLLLNNMHRITIKYDSANDVLILIKNHNNILSKISITYNGTLFLNIIKNNRIHTDLKLKYNDNIDIILTKFLNIYLENN